MEKGRSREESFKKEGSVPFKWEIQPGLPKPCISSSASRNSNSLPKLSPPPSYTNNSIINQRKKAQYFQAPPVSQGCFSRNMQFVKRNTSGQVGSSSMRYSSPRKSGNSARFSPPFKLEAAGKSRAKEEMEFILDQWLF